MHRVTPYLSLQPYKCCHLHISTGCRGSHGNRDGTHSRSIDQEGLRPVAWSGCGQGESELLGECGVTVPAVAHTGAARQGHLFSCANLEDSVKFTFTQMYLPTANASQWKVSNDYERHWGPECHSVTSLIRALWGTRT